MLQSEDEKNLSDTTLLDEVMKNNEKFLEEKRQKYNFDFASDCSPPNLIYIEPFSNNANAVKENFDSPEQLSNWDNISFYDKKSLKKYLKEKLKKPLSVKY